MPVYIICLYMLTYTYIFRESKCTDFEKLKQVMLKVLMIVLTLGSLKIHSMLKYAYICIHKLRKSGCSDFEKS